MWDGFAGCQGTRVPVGRYPYWGVKTHRRRTGNIEGGGGRGWARHWRAGVLHSCSTQTRKRTSDQADVGRPSKLKIRNCMYQPVARAKKCLGSNFKKLFKIVILKINVKKSVNTGPSFVCGTHYEVVAGPSTRAEAGEGCRSPKSNRSPQGTSLASGLLATVLDSRPELERFVPTRGEGFSDRNHDHNTGARNAGISKPKYERKYEPLFGICKPRRWNN